MQKSNNAIRGWSYVIPAKLRGRVHINLLEFLAQLISIWVDISENRVQDQDCLLGMGDNTAAMGWMRRANFREKEEGDMEWLAKQRVARKLASIVLQSNTVLYWQWFKGAENDVVDSLSRDPFYLSHTAQASFLSQTLPRQVPEHFNVRPIPNEISCFITSILQLLPVKQQRLKQPKPSEIALSNVGLLSSFRLESPHSIWSLFPRSNRTSSCQPLPSRSAKQPSLEEIKSYWWKAQPMPPCHMWHRPSGQTTGLTPDWTKMVKCASSSRNNSKGTGMKTVPDWSRKPCQCQCSEKCIK